MKVGAVGQGEEHTPSRDELCSTWSALTVKLSRSRRPGWLQLPLFSSMCIDAYIKRLGRLFLFETILHKIKGCQWLHWSDNREGGVVGRRTESLDRQLFCALLSLIPSSYHCPIYFIDAYSLSHGPVYRDEETCIDGCMTQATTPPLPPSRTRDSPSLCCCCANTQLPTLRWIDDLQAAAIPISPLLQPTEYDRSGRNWRPRPQPNKRKAMTLLVCRQLSSSY